MKCLKQRLIYALKLLLIFTSPLWALKLTKQELKIIASKQLEKKNPNILVEEIIFFGKELILPDKPLFFGITRKNNTYLLEIKDLITTTVLKSIPLKVKFKLKVPVALHDIRIGSIIHAGDFSWKYIFSPYPFRIENPIGLQAKTFIKKGEIIKPSMLEKLTIPSGRKVRVIFYKKGITISTQGVLITNGKVGDIVKVKRGKKIFEGFLKNETTVIVNLN
ncbi:MAG TPA: flagellar basal body P-ring formation protein FlgA [Aquificales bacterium]|nr:flagellar basal body P-ring formation protein FlgA [Aquificales bacterium]